MAMKEGDLPAQRDDGIVRWNGLELTHEGAPSALGHVPILFIVRHRDANIWLGTHSGILRLNAKGVSSLATENAAQSAAVSALFEDRQDNLWVGTAQGIERFRDSAFVTYMTAEGLLRKTTGRCMLMRKDALGSLL